MGMNKEIDEHIQRLVDVMNRIPGVMGDTSALTRTMRGICWRSPERRHTIIYSPVYGTESIGSAITVG